MVRPAIGGSSPLKIDTTRQPWEFTLKNGDAWTTIFRHLPLRSWDERVGETIPWVRPALDHPDFDDFWERSSTIARLSKVAVPNVTCSGWYDSILGQALNYVPELRRKATNATARRHQHLVVGPWGHMLGQPIGELDFGQVGDLNLADVRRQWFGRWLKDEKNEVDRWPFLRLFVMGVNVWRDENEWPLARTQYTQYYFHSHGSANTREGDGLVSTDCPAAESPDRYVYDPADPVPTHGGRSNYVTPCGPQDQRRIEARNDVLVYTSERLNEPLEVTGPVRVILYAATDALDTDWTAKLVDVHPDGRAFNICDGILRARYRESLAKPKLLEPNKVYRYDIDLWATSNVFKRDHRLRVQISSSNFPCFDRNPNTGHAFGADVELRKANQTVYHDQERPSHILLPVIPR
jgi:putative CocE/NonD family hydrolase